MSYVYRYHATLPPKHIPESEAALLGPEWSDKYIFQPYPTWRYHRTKGGRIVQNAEEEAALGPGWAGTPAVFDEANAIVTGERTDPCRWVDDWPAAGLSVKQRAGIKAQLKKADAAFSRSAPEDPTRHTAPMQQAFNGIADVLFQAKILTPDLLENKIPVLIWESAIAGGWWGPASDERTEGFSEQLGHYWVWADHSKEWRALFRAVISEWLAKLLEDSAPADSGLPLPPKKTPSQWLTEYKIKKKIKSHEQVADHLGLERSVYFDLKAGRKVSEETYIKAALCLGCSPDDLKP